MGIKIGDWDSLLGLGIRIELGIMIRDLGLESGIGDWGLRIEDWGLGIGMGIRDLGLGIGIRD